MTLDASLLQRAIPDGSMRYFAWLYTPNEYRDVVAALFLLESELRDTANAPHDVAHIRLQWWRDEIERLANSNAQHPATRVLQTHRNSNVDFSVLDATLRSTAQDIAHSTYERDVELNQYLNGQGALFALMAQYLVTDTAGTKHDELPSAATQLGALVRHVELLRDLKADVHHGRLYMPLDELDKLNIEYEVLESKDWPDAFVTWLRERCATIVRQHTQLTQALRASEASVLRPLLVIAALHVKLLNNLSGDVKRIINTRLELGAFTKLWTAWRAATRC
ncbi:MAG TPA: squalene/phytoene synthase family protein [Steroidobacteraceae bacterium]|nr:squalene/phytoene synthase family protein [Steroidobacteraceae bacterium]